MINWKKVWKSFDKWIDQIGSGSLATYRQKKIEQLVEKQVPKKVYILRHSRRNDVLLSATFDKKKSDEWNKKTFHWTEEFDIE